MSDSLQIIIGIISSLILFLYGIESLSNELLTFNSYSFRTFLSKITQNRVMGMFLGLISSAIVQSRSTIIGMTLSLVNASIITFKNSLSIILGANIGIALSSQLVFIDTQIFAPILITLGFILKTIGGKIKIASKPIFFTGVIIFALQLLSKNINVLNNNSFLIDFFSQFDNIVLAFVVSALVTGIIHSSTVILGTIIILVQAGLIPMDVAIVMILGANFGSTLSVMLSSISLDSYAKKTSFLNVFLNTFTSFFVFLFLNKAVSFTSLLPGSSAQQVAYANLIFNVSTMLFFMPLINPIVKIIERFFPSKEEEIQFKTKYIILQETSDIQEQYSMIKKELTNAIENTQKIYKSAMKIFYKPSELLLMQIEKRELYNDYLDDQITLANIELIKNISTKDIASSSVNTIKISNNIEQMGDLGKDLKDVFIKMHKKGIPQLSVDITSICQIEKQFQKLLNLLKVAILNNNAENIANLKEYENKIVANIQKNLDNHINKILEKKGYIGSVFVDALSILELSIAKVREIRKILE
ncbi:MAG TPA: Na/Pi symporter [Candidatus Dojkabacteria bacterium]|nr:Na/Pi symporter [Candidatus Dojkabacteria bacterium]HQF36743.1 Na/Pi symporter [Candidatus Dojkabacteria bacterium]